MNRYDCILQWKNLKRKISITSHIINICTRTIEMKIRRIIISPSESLSIIKIYQNNSFRSIIEKLPIFFVERQTEKQKS